MSFYSQREELSTRLWILVLAASIPVAYMVDHLLVVRYAPALHGWGVLKMVLVLGKSKWKVPGEWGIVATCGIPFFTAAILAFPYGEGWPSRTQAYWPRLLKVACYFIALPFALLASALVSPLVELAKVPIDYISMTFVISMLGHELGEIESSLILLPVILLLFVYVLYRRFSGS